MSAPVVNPLLDTIGALTSDSDSSDEREPSSRICGHGRHWQPIRRRHYRPNRCHGFQALPMDCQSSESRACDLCLSSTDSTAVDEVSVSAVANSGQNSNHNNKCVRFDSAVNDASPLASPKAERQCGVSGDYGANYCVNKSILKDPLCETLRSTIKAGEFNADCSLEGEIDTLLYGRTGCYYSPERKAGHLDESPASTYVAMIEGKYHTVTRKSSTVKPSSITLKKAAKGLAHAPELRLNATLSGSSVRAKPGPCMLEILDNLHHAQQSANANLTKRKPPFEPKTVVRNGHPNRRLYSRAVGSQPKSIDLLMRDLSLAQSDTSDRSSVSYRTPPEHHIYEEILYDCLNSQPKPRKYPAYPKVMSLF